MPEDIGLFEAMNSQRAIRYMKPDPVPEELITRLIEAATRAPSGTNRQRWGFLVIRDAELRRKLERDPANPELIITVRKAGYRIAADR